MIKYQIYNYSKANNIASLVFIHYMYKCSSYTLYAFNDLK